MNRKIHYLFVMTTVLLVVLILDNNIVFPDAGDNGHYGAVCGSFGVELIKEEV